MAHQTVPPISSPANPHPVSSALLLIPDGPAQPTARVAKTHPKGPQLAFSKRGASPGRCNVTVFQPRYTLEEVFAYQCDSTDTIRRAIHAIVFLGKWSEGKDKDGNGDVGRGSRRLFDICKEEGCKLYPELREKV